MVAKDAQIIRPGSVLRVPVSVPFPSGTTCLYVEHLELRNRNSEAFFGAPDSLIQAGDPFLQIANFTDQPVTIQKGRLLGWAQNPDGWLDSSTIRTPEEVELLEAHAAAIQAVVHDLLDKPTASPSDQEGGESGELSGGPKTAEVPDPDPIPSSYSSLTDKIFH